MRIKFNQAVRLPPGPNGKDYPRGVHHVSDEALKHPFFHKLIHAGMVEDADGTANAGLPLSHPERRKKLAEKIAGQTTKSKTSDDTLKQQDNPSMRAEKAAAHHEHRRSGEPANAGEADAVNRAMGRPTNVSEDEAVDFDELMTESEADETADKIKTEFSKKHKKHKA